jgi:flagellum-specific peptidoglycan hydrolase FlgJ
LAINFIPTTKKQMTKTTKIGLFILGLFLLFKTTKKVMTFNKSSFIEYITPPLKKIGESIGVPYKFLVAQVILETGWGKSSLFTKYYNVGGVKAVRGQSFVTLPTFEYIDNRKVRVLQNFATYPTLEAGLIAYSKIFQNRYFKQYLNKTTDPYKYVELLQSGKIKYATDIAYIGKIHKILNTYLS